MIDKFIIDDFMEMINRVSFKIVKNAKYDKSESAEVMAINTVGGFKEYTLRNAGATSSYKTFSISTSVPVLIVGDWVIVRHIKNGSTNFFIDAKIEKRT